MLSVPGHNSMERYVPDDPDDPDTPLRVLSYEEAEAILRQLGGSDFVPPEPMLPEPVPQEPQRSNGPPKGTTAFPLPQLAANDLRELVEAVPDALVVIDQSGRLILVNRQTEQLFGYHRDELLGQPVEVLVPERFRDKHVGYRDGYFAAPHLRPMGVGLELVGQRKDGHEVPVEISLSPLHSGSVLFVVSTIRDVTQRRNAESQLRKLEQRYRSLVEGIPAVTFMATLDEVDEQALYVSPQIEELLGFTQQEWLENPILWYTQLHPDDQERWHEEFSRTVSTAEPFSAVYRFIARDGKVVWVRGEAKVIRDEVGRPLFLQGVAFDITGIKQAEEELKALNATLDARVVERTAVAEQRAEELVRSNDALKRFAGVVAHDLKNPLLTIQGRIYSLVQNHADMLDEKARGLIDRAVMAGPRMTTLVNDVLEYSKVRTEPRVPVPSDSARAFEAACGDLGAAIEASGAEVTAGELPTVLADPTQLRQVFQNLIANALKYRSQMRPPRVHVTARRQSAEWVFEVTDNGIGIESNYLKKIFIIGKSSRVHKQEGIPGSGIGLTTCEAIIQRYGGRMWASSPGLDQGTTISFTLPVT
jgi:PAS domain S-box-containing protein